MRKLKSKVRCLLVEDEVFVGEVLRSALEDAGFEVVGPVKELEAAVRQASSEPIDIAVLDVAVHGGDVYPAADELRKRNIPFVFHTGYGDRRELGTNYPHTPVLAKPLDEDSLLAALLSFVLAREPNSGNNGGPATVH